MVVFAKHMPSVLRYIPKGRGKEVEPPFSGCLPQKVSKSCKVGKVVWLILKSLYLAFAFIATLFDHLMKKDAQFEWD